MPTYYRSSPKRSPRKRKRKRRFRSPSVAVFDPRRLLPDPTPAAQRPRRAKKRRKRQSWLQIIRSTWDASHYFALVLALLALMACLWIGISPTFYVYSPVIEGDHYTPHQHVIDTMQVDGMSAFFIDPNELKTQLEEQLPHVQQADVRLTFPARLTVQLQEWEPELLYRLSTGQYWANQAGNVAPVADDRPLPELIDLEQAVSIDSRHIQPDVVKAVLQIHKALPEVKTFRYEEQQGLWFVSPEGWVVWMGEPARINRNLALWEQLRKRFLQEGRDLQLIDLRYQRPRVH